MRGTLTAKYLVQTLVKLEPIRQCSEDEEEDCETKQQQRSEDARRIPNFACQRRNEPSITQSELGDIVNARYAQERSERERTSFVQRCLDE